MPKRSRDIDVNYYVRGLTSKRVRHSLSKPKFKSVDFAAYEKIPKLSHFHPQSVKFPVYVTFAYVGTVILCAFSCIYTHKSAKVKSESKVEHDKSILKDVAQAHATGNLSIEKLKSFVSRLSSEWSPNTAMLPSIFVPLMLMFGTENVSEDKDFSEISSAKNKETGGWLFSNYGNSSYFSSHILSSLYSQLQAFSQICPSLSEKLNTHIIERISDAMIAGHIDNCIRSGNAKEDGVPARIGSSSESYWDENSPLINPKLPSQLPSLLAVPELCV